MECKKIEKKRVLVTLSCLEGEEERFREAVPEYEFVFSKNYFPPEELETIEIIVGKPPVEYIRQAPNLEWVQSDFAGVERYTDNPLFPRDLLLTNVTGAFGHSISEYLLTMVLSLYKKMHLYRDQQGNGIWKDRGEEKTLTGKTVLIVGAGDIGSRFAELLTIFGTTTWGIRRVKREKPACFNEMFSMKELDWLLPKVDVVALCLPGTKETAGLMDERRLRLMKKDAVLLNVGRGSAVVTEDLIRVMKEGHLYGAAMDVTNPEPLPENHPLWKQENVILTPHVSGGSFDHLEETYHNIIKICVENLRRYADGRPLLNQIDFSTGYRRL